MSPFTTFPAKTLITAFPTPLTNSASSAAFTYPSSLPNLPTRPVISSTATALLYSTTSPFFLPVPQSCPQQCHPRCLRNRLPRARSPYGFVASRESVSNEPKYIIATSPNSRPADIGLQLDPPHYYHRHPAPTSAD
jgi:hypothetical protein